MGQVVTRRDLRETRFVTRKPTVIIVKFQNKRQGGNREISFIKYFNSFIKKLFLFFVTTRDLIFRVKNNIFLLIFKYSELFFWEYLERLPFLKIKLELVIVLTYTLNYTCQNKKNHCFKRCIFTRKSQHAILNA